MDFRFSGNNGDTFEMICKLGGVLTISKICDHLVWHQQFACDLNDCTT